MLLAHAPGGDVRMPILGLGGGIFHGAEDAFLAALEEGYRLFDTAPKYGPSEEALGRAIQRSGVKRNELFLVSKVGNYESPTAVLESFERSLMALGTEHLDLLLLHSAVNQAASKDPSSRLHASARLATWNVLATLRATGRVRAIGVANHSPRQLAALTPPPDVVQLEYHPLLQRGAATIDYCRARGIAVMVYGSGGGGWQLWKKDGSLDLLGRKPIQEAAIAHSVSTHQISLRWALERGVAVIPKAASREHQRQNRQLFHFALTPAEDRAIAALDEGRSLYKFRDPDSYA